MGNEVLLLCTEFMCKVKEKYPEMTLKDVVEEEKKEEDEVKDDKDLINL